ncbi:transmembrane protein 135 isoform X1 [Megachile rotundata]|uniref:transmembrane protein 135 isoform X1 n=2 Tax=Megachile rotundata TaxID=143995 RepID=UPI000614F66F|nr:PREDICTED: transmembrane protein 135-like isoform X1 [Megachile rotundata]XP_012142424.1 PREDICTED: transmembrane protein 135-like isoform X1 [Megachile rotundata]XP_012142426.1 PREDICTED: transmembrane protein 135-like isoform X1 [Megachile rotundata]
MPTQFSKFIDTSCKEFLHPWEDSCINATTGLGLHTLQESVKIYCTVYILAFLMKGKKPSKEDIKKTILGILQSTAFLAWNSLSYSMFICTIRHLLGGFTIWSVSFLPSFLSSLTAILIERPPRRTLLSLYVANVATESIFLMGLARNYYSSIPNGGTYIFATSIALLLYFFRSKTNKQDSIYGILRILVGRYEDPDYIKQSDSQSKLQTSSDSESSTKVNHISKKCNKKNLNIFMKSLEAYQKIIDQLKQRSKHSPCPHPHSCTHYVLKGGIKVLGYALSAQLVVKLFFQMKNLFKKPQLLKSAIFKKSNLNLAVFLGSFTGLYRLVSCLLRRSFNKDSSYYAIPAGLIAGLTFMAYSSNTIALYFMWKALQLLWNDLTEKKIVPEVKWFAIFFYSFSTAVLFHAAVLEPHNLRTSYWKFLYNISGGRIAVMSRIPLDQFGLESSRRLAEVLRKTNTTDKHTFKF